MILIRSLLYYIIVNSKYSNEKINGNIVSPTFVIVIRDVVTTHHVVIHEVVNY